jgi:hypothetical protein
MPFGYFLKTKSVHIFELGTVLDNIIPFISSIQCTTLVLDLDSVLLNLVMFRHPFFTYMKSKYGIFFPLDLAHHSFYI